MRLKLFPTAIAMAVIAIANFVNVADAQPLLIDFNSLTQDGGPHPQEEYQSYDAGHEVPADFDTKEYGAFGTEVTVTPGWPDTPNEALTMQSIDRGANHDAFWQGDKVDLLTDWLGVDTRTGNGGNGNFTFEDGGEFTRLTLTLGGLPAGKYDWISYHHDTEWIHAQFFAEFSVDGGTSFDVIEDDVNGESLFEMTSSNDTGGDPPAEEHYQGDVDPDPILLPSTLIWSFQKPTDEEDFVIRFTPIAHTAVHTQLIGINGFELYQSTPTISGDFNNDGEYTIADMDLLYGALGSDDPSFDLNQDAMVDGGDVTSWLSEAGEALGYTEAIRPGDANLDGVVNATDLNVVGGSWQATDVVSWGDGDFTQDGAVTAPDLNGLGSNWQSDIRGPIAAQSVPEPTGLFLAAFALVALYMRRRF